MTQNEKKNELKFFAPYCIPFFIITLFTLFISVYYLHLHQSWWFEDDPCLFYEALQIKNVFQIFFDRAFINHWGNSFVPFQILSYWIDVKLFGISVKVAYLHNIFSLILATFSLYLVMEAFTGKKIASVCFVLVWTLLPTTISTLHFISTRHYIEGLIFAAMAVFLLKKKTDRAEEKQNIGVSILICMFASMLCKEVYITTLPVFLFLYAAHKKHYKTMNFIVIVAIIYASYRLWAIGYTIKHHNTGIIPFPLEKYPELVSACPIVFAAGKKGILIYSIFALIAFFSVVKNKQKIKEIIFLLVLTTVSFLPIIVVGTYVVMHQDRPGTWYRVLFAINTLVYLFFVYMLCTNFNKLLQGFVLSLLLILLIPGIQKTQSNWNFLKYHAEMEGKFLINNQDKLLLSTVPAEWFLDGISNLYNLKKDNYFWVWNMNKRMDTYQKRILEYKTKYLYNKGRIVLERNEIRLAQ